MSSIGWEFFGLKFSWLVTSLLTVFFTLYVWLTAKDTHRTQRLDTTAGDEGEEW
jgi:hypothetical protein